MKIVIQRVTSASVRVNNEVIGKIGKGLLLLAGFHKDDTDEDLKWVCNKITKLRIFEDNEGKMNKSVHDVDGSLLVISQFTLYGNVKKGTRPSFIDAAPPGIAEPMYKRMINIFKESGLKTESGKFAAMMDVQLVNSGPVTIILEK
jgi:D-aminoacyl-tRNA deacylase